MFGLNVKILLCMCGSASAAVLNITIKGDQFMLLFQLFFWQLKDYLHEL